MRTRRTVPAHRFEMMFRLYASTKAADHPDLSVSEQQSAINERLPRPIAEGDSCACLIEDLGLQDLRPRIAADCYRDFGRSFAYRFDYLVHILCRFHVLDIRNRKRAYS
jgi:hypothetical protein